MKYLVVGDGIAGSTAAEILSSNEEHEVTLVTDEERPLYNRILLKTYMIGEHPINLSSVHDREFYQQKGIDLQTGTKVTEVDPETKAAKTQEETLDFDRALIATGGTPKVFPLDEEYENFHYMWSWESAKRIRNAAEASQKAVVIGGGLLGIDLAIAYASHGCQTHYLIREGCWWSDGLNDEIAEKIHNRLERKGVNIHLNSEATSMISDGKKVETVQYHQNGSVKRQEVDSIAAAIGQKPNSELIDAEKDSENRLKTGPHLKTSRKDIFAAGNMVNYKSEIFEKRTVHGSWDHSREMGRRAAKNMLPNEQTKPFKYVNTYGVGHFNKELQAVGEWIGRQLSVTSSEGEGVLYSDGGTLVGAVQFGQVFDLEKIEKAIREKRNVEDLDIV